MRPVIVVVDDETTVLVGLRDQLKRGLQDEYAIETAESGEEGLALITELHGEGRIVPLVIADHLMPGLKGDRFLIQVHERYPSTLTMLLTGQASAEAVGNAVNGAQLYRYLAKPWDEEDLILTVRAAVQSYVDQLELSGKTAELVAINEQLKAELEAHARLFTAVEHSADSIMITSPDGTIEYVNPAFEESTGYAAAYAIGRNPRFLMSGLHEDEFFNEMWTTLRSGSTWSGVFLNRNRDGCIAEYRATISPVFDDSGEIICFVEVKHDITRERALEQKVRQKAKMEALGTLAGGIVHDFGNFLTPIRAWAELGAGAAPPEGTLRQYFVHIEAAALGARDLVEQISLFSRGEEPETEAFELGEILDEAMTLVRQGIPEGVELHVEVDDHGQLVRGTRTQLHSLVTNLVTNAIYALREEGGRLDVTLSSENLNLHEARDLGLQAGAYATLIIKDTGCGIPEDVSKRVFDPFFTTKPVGEGTGMGLAVVHGIVETHLGAITIESELGTGTTIEVRLPIC